jgi:hypothetical protein
MGNLREGLTIHLTHKHQSNLVLAKDPYYPKDICINILTISEQWTRIAKVLSVDKQTIKKSTQMRMFLNR